MDRPAAGVRADELVKTREQNSWIWS